MQDFTDLVLLLRSQRMTFSAQIQYCISDMGNLNQRSRSDQRRPKKPCSGVIVKEIGNSFNIIKLISKPYKSVSN